MELEKFLGIIFNRQDKEFTTHYYRNVVTRKGIASWWFIQETKKLTEEVDFNKVCQFGKTGCYAYANAHLPHVQMCCCGACRARIGYLYQIPKNIGTLKIISKKFDNKTGFWRRKGGCALPREFRSRTCLTYLCLSVQPFMKRFSNRERLIMDMVGNPFKYYNRYNKHQTSLKMSDFVEYELNKKAKRRSNNG